MRDSRYFIRLFQSSELYHTVTHSFAFSFEIHSHFDDRNHLCWLEVATLQVVPPWG